jgi:hypothetical protein
VAGGIVPGAVVAAVVGAVVGAVLALPAVEQPTRKIAVAPSAANR